MENSINNKYYVYIEFTLMHYKSDDIEIIISNETDAIIKELFLQRYEIGLETSSER